MSGKKAHQLNPNKAAVSSWIFTIARNARADHLRRVNRPEANYNDSAFVPDTEPQPHDIVSHVQEEKRLRDFTIAGQTSGST